MPTLAEKIEKIKEFDALKNKIGKLEDDLRAANVEFARVKKELAAELDLDTASANGAASPTPTGKLRRISAEQIQSWLSEDKGTTKSQILQRMRPEYADSPGLAEEKFDKVHAAQAKKAKTKQLFFEDKGKFYSTGNASGRGRRSVKAKTKKK